MCGPETALCRIPALDVQPRRVGDRHVQHEVRELLAEAVMKLWRSACLAVAHTVGNQTTETTCLDPIGLPQS